MPGSPNNAFGRPGVRSDKVMLSLSWTKLDISQRKEYEHSSVRDAPHICSIYQATKLQDQVKASPWLNGIINLNCMVIILDEFCILYITTEHFSRN